MWKSNAAPDAPVRVDPAARRRHRVLVTPTLLRVLALLSLAALIFGAYVVTWVSSRDAYFTTRNFRILAGLGKQIESIVAVQSDGLRYGALGEEVEEPARQETESVADVLRQHVETPLLSKQIPGIGHGAGGARERRIGGEFRFPLGPELAAQRPRHQPRGDGDEAAAEISHGEAASAKDGRGSRTAAWPCRAP